MTFSELTKLSTRLGYSYLILVGNIVYIYKGEKIVHKGSQLYVEGVFTLEACKEWLKGKDYTERHFYEVDGKLVSREDIVKDYLG